MQTKMLTFEEAFNCANAFNEFYAEKMSGRVASKLYRVGKPFSHLREDYEELVNKFPKPNEENVEEVAEYTENIMQINSSPFDEFEMLTWDTIEELNLSPLTIQRLESLIMNP